MVLIEGWFFIRGSFRWRYGGIDFRKRWSLHTWRYEGKDFIKKSCLDGEVVPVQEFSYKEIRRATEWVPVFWCPVNQTEMFQNKEVVLEGLSLVGYSFTWKYKGKSFRKKNCCKREMVVGEKFIYKYMEIWRERCLGGGGERYCY